jgi:hypothetical protein
MGQIFELLPIFRFMCINCEIKANWETFLVPDPVKAARFEVSIINNII